MTNRTSDEALQEYIDKLGEDRGRYVKAVENDLFNLRMHAEVYEAFFGTNNERVDLFNSISGDTAYWIERSMFESLVLQVCRLTDPVVSLGKKRNVTVNALPSLLSGAPDGELEARIVKAESSTRFARDWRNRRIAHTDEQIRLGSATLDNASRAKLKEAIETIAACIRRYALVELNTTLMTHPIRQYGRDEISFLTALYHGNLEHKRLKAVRKDLIERGEWSQIERLEVLPEWLTKRSEEKEDFE